MTATTINTNVSKRHVARMFKNEKWDALAGVEFLTQDNTATLQGKSIILVDDKYQSGITLQFVASRLLEKGASKVFGLCAVKTWRDDDNTS